MTKRQTIVSVILVVLLMIIIGVSSYVLGRHKQSDSKQTLSPTPTKTAEIASYVLTLLDRSKIEIKKNSKFITWHEWFIVGLGYYEEQYVYAFNLLTGETKKLYENKSTRQGIDDLVIIDNNLFVSIGGYLAGGGLYQFNLPPDSKPAKLVTESSGEIIKIDDRYWLRSGEGDACWYSGTYALFDPKSFKVTTVAEESQDCDGSGETILTLNYNQSVIVTKGVGDTSIKTEGDNNPIIYTSVYQIFYNSPKQKHVLISTKNMPKGVNSVEFDREREQIVLKSKSEFFLFDPKKKLLTKFDNYVPLPTLTSVPISESYKIKFEEIGPMVQKIPTLKTEIKYE